MNFVFRHKEINELRRLRWLSEEQYSRTIVVTGIPGIGKTALIKEALSGYKVLFLCASHKSEGLMVRDFTREITSKTSLQIGPSERSLSSIFDLLFEASVKESFTLVIDQYHLLSLQILSHLASLISAKKRKTNLNLVLVSSDEIASNSLFQNEDDVLFNCIDSVISLRPFSILEMKSVLEQSEASFSLQNLFILYAVSGGIPKYVEAMISSFDMLSEIYRNGSLFIDEGNVVLNRILGKNSEVYYSILDVISRGAKSQSEIETELEEAFNVGGHLAKLESVYGLLRKSRPAFSPVGARGVVRYSLTNPFLEFWFRYIEFYRPMIEMGDYDSVIALVRSRLASEGKVVLERYFRDKLSQENDSYQVASWWSTSSKAGDKSLELPIIACSTKSKKIVIADVCFSASEFDKDQYLKAVKKFKLSTGKTVGVDTRLFVMDDM